MSVTRELVAALRRRLGSDAPLPPPPASPDLIEVLPVGSRDFAREAARYTTALLGIGSVGTRYATELSLQFQAELAVAHGAVASLLPEGWLESQGLLELCSRVSDHKEYLLRPDLGRRLSEQSLSRLIERSEKNKDVQIILADGLSALACQHSGMTVVQNLVRECQTQGLSVGTLTGARFARVWLEDEIGQATQAKVAIIILGERPGLGTGDGLSAYMVYNPAVGKTDADRNMISNIHERGMAPADAARRLAFLARAMVDQKTSGVSLKLPGSEATASGYREGLKRIRLVEVEV
ncbi:MAG: ethanolamine ammonia-lyase subunit EutC [Spirochaetales bacterium]|nr:ethanolamine ammonia-lyase subunit EutC [Spirochaetales bacterium]